MEINLFTIQPCENNKYPSCLQPNLVQNPRGLMHLEKKTASISLKGFRLLLYIFSIIAFGLWLSNLTNIFLVKQDGRAITFSPRHLMTLPQKVMFVDGVLQFHWVVNIVKGKLLYTSKFCFFIFMKWYQTIVLTFGRNVKQIVGDMQVSFSAMKVLGW